MYDRLDPHHHAVRLRLHCRRGGGGIDLSGKRAIVAGGSSGIGVETARALASAGAEVTITGRNLDAGADVVADITATTASPAVHLHGLDLADQASVVEFADGWSGPLDILVNNAGIMAVPDLQRTREGWELQFATDHLGHFALAVRLHDALAEAGNARIVSLSSRGHHYSPVVFEDINFEARRTSRTSPTGSRRPPTCSFRWRPRVAGPTTASPRTRRTRARS